MQTATAEDESNLDRIRQLTVDLEMTERELAERETVMSRLMDSTPALLLVIDHETIVLASAAWERVLGYSRGELEGRRWLPLVHPEDREETMQAAKSMSGQRLDHFHSRWIARDGTYHRLCWSSSRWDADGYAYATAVHRGVDE